MQNIVIDRPYEFVPPGTGDFWPSLMRRWVPRHLRSFGVGSVTVRHAERLRASFDAGHGVLVAANHCRPYDPFALDSVGVAAGRHVHIMAGWHLFMQGRVQRFLLQRCGIFSVWREGTDRESLKCAISILVAARRPLLLFPEGVVSRHNDRLNPLMDGTALLARAAAKERAAATPPGRVVIHPVAIRWVFDGDLGATAGPMLDDIERRLSWRPQRHRSLAERISRAGEALLVLKEMEYAGRPGSGPVAPRLAALAERILRPLEDEWTRGRHDGPVVARVKAIRTGLMPGLTDGSSDAAERERRWRHIEDTYVAQQLSLYPEGYLDEPTPERILETVERMEEDLTDDVRPVPGLRGVLDVGDAIDVAPERRRGGDGDPLMTAVRESLATMLAASLAEFRPGARMP